MINSTTTDTVTVGELTLSIVLRNVDNQVELMISDHVHHIVISFLIRPGNSRCRNVIILEELGSTAGSIDLVTVLDQLLSRLQQSNLSFGATGGYQDILLWQTITCSNECIEHGLMQVVTQTTYLTSR